MIGYRWFIEFPTGIPYEPNEKTFLSYKEAEKDAISHGYNSKVYGIDMVKDDDGFIDVIKNVKPVEEAYYID